MEILSIYIFILIFYIAATPFLENALIVSDLNRDFHAPINLLQNNLTGPINTNIKQNGLGDYQILTTLTFIVDSPRG